MESTASLSELSPQDLKTREVAQDYARIEENTEFLTHMIRYRPRCKRVEADLAQQTPDIRSILALVVQISYFLFTCHVKDSNVLIGRKMVLLNSSRPQQQPHVAYEYLLEKDLFSFPKAEQQFAGERFMKHELGPQNPQSYGNTVLKYIGYLMSIARFQIEKLKIVQDKQVVGQFVGLEGMIKRFLEPKIKMINNPRIIILTLEETELFRQNSLLLKVMNNSIFSAMRQCKNIHIFHQLLELESPITHHRHRDPHKHSLQIENAIENLMKLMIKNELIMVDQSINESLTLEQRESFRGVMGKHDDGMRKEYILGEVEGQGHERRYVCRMQIAQRPVREMTGQVFEQIVQEANNDYQKEEVRSNKGDRKGTRRNEFVVEYIGSRGLLVVKYVTGVELNIENTDVTMLQCNNIAYHWSYATIELHERMSAKGSKKKERFVAFKTVAHLALADNPLLKLLAMVDLVMMCAKIGEPELRPGAVGKGEDGSRLQATSRKVEHMLQLFVLKVEKYYRAVAESCGQE